MNSETSPMTRPGAAWTYLIRYLSPAVVCAAAAPLWGAAKSAAWVGVLLLLLLARRRAEVRRADKVRAVLESLVGVTYAWACLQLLETGNTAGEVLATSMLGVGLFAVLVRDYRNTRRLQLNVLPYAGVIVIMQWSSIAAALHAHRPELVTTIVGAPILVTTVFMLLRRDLVGAHDKLASALLQAEASARAESEFLANMSHEIRTPLNAVTGFASILETSADLTDVDRAHVRSIMVGGADLITIVNDVLDSSRIHAGQIALKPEATAIAPFMQESVALFRPIADAAPVRLDLQVAPEADVRLHLDPVRLRQIVGNLVGNALKFTSAGVVTVRVAFRSDERRLSVEVQDTGAGVPADQLDGLFERFSQGRAPDGRRVGGSGLGLSISRGLARLMGGDVALVSTSKTGSTFRATVFAPVARGRAPVSAPSLGSRGSGPHAAHVLVVDDHEANRRLLRLMLEAAGHEVTEAAGGAQAAELAGGARYDLILMDLQMPGMDGFETTTAIRRPAAPNVATPIIACSADVLPEQVQRCLAAGMDGHLAKPVRPAALLGLVESWTARDVGRGVRRAEPDTPVRRFSAAA